MKARWPLVPLSLPLRQVQDALLLEDDGEYKQVTVSLYGRGLRLRQVTKGSDIKTKRQYRIRTDQFVYSRIDARNGAFGVVPADLDGAIVSSDFPVFDVDLTVAEPQFIALITQTQWFRSLCKDPSRGVTNRKRMSEALLLALEVTLPPMDEQVRLVKKVNSVISRVTEAHQLRDLIESQRNEMLCAQAREMSRDVPRRPLREIAPVVRRPVRIDPNASYPELGIRSFGKGTFHKPAVPGNAIGSKRIFQIEPGDLVLSNVFAWEGAVAVAQEADRGRFGSHRYITCVPDPRLATAEFLRAWLLTDEGMGYILEASPGAAGRNRTLGLKKLNNIPVPVPTLAAQHQFSRLSARLAAAAESQTVVGSELKGIIPAVLDQALRGEL